MCTGEYIGVLNSDDFFTTNDSVSTIVDTLSQPGVEAVFGDVNYKSNPDSNKVLRYCKSVGWTPEKFGWGYMPNHLTYYTKRANYDKHGYFELDYQICADYELLIKHLYKAKLPYHYIKECLVTMRPGGISNGSLSKRLTLNKEIIRACRAHDINTNFLKISAKIFSKTFEYINPKP